MLAGSVDLQEETKSSGSAAYVIVVCCVCSGLALITNPSSAIEAKTLTKSYATSGLAKQFTETHWRLCSICMDEKKG